MRWMHVFTVLILLLSNTAFADVLCNQGHHTIEHKPRADVAHNPHPAFDMDPIDIPVTIDLVDRYGLALPMGTQLDAPLGFISVYKDGRILYDGVDISDKVEDHCDHDSERAKAEQPTESQNGN